MASLRAVSALCLACSLAIFATKSNSAGTLWLDSGGGDPESRDYWEAVVNATSCSSFSRAAPDEMLRWAIAAASRKSSAIPETTSAAAAFNTTTSVQGPVSPRSTL